MKYLSGSRDKRAISVILGYVILIGITISLSVLVFSWLKFHVNGSGGEIEECPDGVSLIITEATCQHSPNGHLNISIKNNGRYHLDGFVIRVNDRPGADSGFYSFDQEISLEIGKQRSQKIIFETFGSNITTLNFVEVQPYLQKNSIKNYCNQGDSFKIECYS